MPDASSSHHAQPYRRAANYEPIKVCLLGASGAGKTCFLAGLTVLSEPDRASLITVLHDNTKTANYLDSLQNTLRSRQWPPPNNATFILDMTVMVERRAIDLRVVDYPGEDFTGALRTLETAEIDDLYRFSQQAQIFLLLFSPHRDLAGGEPRDTNATLIARQAAHLQAITQVWKERSLGTPSGAKRSHPIELGLVVTQCDRVPGLTTPQAAKQFFLTRAPNLVAKITALADGVDFFGISVLGPPTRGNCSQVITGNSLPPPHLQPYGYEPLFEWICNYRKRHYMRRMFPRLFSGLVAAALAGAIGFGMWRAHVADAHAILVGDRPVLDRIEATSPWFLDASTRQLRDDLVRQTVQRLSDEVERANTPDEFQQLTKECASLADADTESFRPQVSSLRQAVTARERHVLFSSLERDFQSTPRPVDFPSRASAFVDRFQSGQEVDSVRDMTRALEQEVVTTRRARIKGMPTSNSLDIAAKARAILEFASASERMLTPGELERMRRAAAMAQSFSERRNWSVTIKKSGGFTAAYAQSVLLGRKNLGDQDLHNFDGSYTGEVKDKTWTADPAIISWQAGDRLVVTLKFEGYINDGWVADQIDDSPLAIGSLVGRRNLQVKQGWGGYVKYPYVEFQVNGLSPSDWSAVESYISPGSAW